jgi:hypothetical protein
MSVHENLDQRDLRYFKFAFGRAQVWPDDKIVSELADPDIDSPQVLYRLLSQDNYPVCPECGMAPVKATHCDSSEIKRERRPREGGGNKSALPPPATAQAIFDRAIDRLKKMSHELLLREEHRQDKRFVLQETVPLRDNWGQGPGYGYIVAHSLSRLDFSHYGA